MKTELSRTLTLCETDIEGALKRFGNNEALYVMYLQQFIDEPTMSQLVEAMAKRDYYAAFTAAHALKGLAGNLGFIPLYHSTAELVMCLRAKKYAETDQLYIQAKNSYNDVVRAIRIGLDAVQ